MKRFLARQALCSVALLVAGGAWCASAAEPAKVTYTEHVQAIFRQKCFSCHNADKKEGGLDLSTFTAVMAGGSSGEAIDPGNPSGSYLWSLVTHESEPKMPPKSEKLAAEHLAVISKWIEGGALDNPNSKALVSKKPKVDLKVAGAATERPAGPPPMPLRLSLAPVVKTRTTTAVSSLAVSPWATLAAVPGQKQVLLYDTKSLELVGVLPFPEGTPQVLRFSRNGQLLLAGGGKGGSLGKVIVWDVRKGERVFEVGDELDMVLAADLSADQSLIALGGPAKIVRVYSTADGKLVWESKKHTDWITSLQFSPDSVLLGTGDRNGGIFVWEAETGREFHSLRAHTAAITGCSWRLDSNLLASASEDGQIRLWEMENGASVKNWAAHPGGAAAVDFARDGRLVSAGRDKVVKVWDQNGAQQRVFEPLADISLAAAFCNETNRVVGGDWTGAVRVWNAVDGAKLGELTPNPATLEERLAAAQAAIPAVQAEQKTAADAHTATQAAAEKARADAAGANQKLADLTKTVADATGAIAKTKEALASAQAAHDAAAKAAAALEAEAAKPADPAATTDAAAEAAAKAQAEARAQAIAAHKKTVSEKAAEAAKAKEQLAALEKSAAENTAALEAIKPTLPVLAAAEKAAAEKAVATKAAADAAQAKLAQSQQSVARWTGEIQFAARLKALDDLRASVAPAVNAATEAQAALQQRKTELAAAQAAVTVNQQAADTANAGIAAARQGVLALIAAQQQAAATVTGLDAALPPLQDAHTKSAAAAAATPTDQTLAAASAALKAALEKHQATVAQAKTALAEKSAAAAKAQADVANLEQKAAAAIAARDAANAKAAELAKGMKPAEDQLASAKQAADKALEPVNALQHEIQKLREGK